MNKIDMIEKLDNKQQVLLSIVVPVYNVEPFLEDCIRSIERIRTPKEIICINDGSTDNSLSVLKELAGEFDDILILEQENKGVSSARNNGIDQASGKYICFFDSDDMVIAETVDYAVELLEKEGLDCVSFGYREIAENVTLQDALNTKMHREEYTLSSDIKNLYGRGYLWHAIMLKDIIDEHHITFLKMKYFEDKCFVMDFCAKCSKVKTITEPGYLYRYRSTSVMHSASRSKPLAEDAVTAAVHMRENAKNSTNEEYQESCRKWYELYVLHTMTASITVPEYTARQVIDGLRRNGLYPFKPVWRLLIPNGKSTLMNYLRFGFFSKTYYSLFFFAVRLIKRIK